MGVQNETKRDLSVIGIRELPSGDYLEFCLKRIQGSSPVWSTKFFGDAVLLKYEIDYYSRFTLNIFIIEEKGLKYFFELFVSLKPGEYHDIANVAIACDIRNEPALVTATYNIHDISLTSHIANYHTEMSPSKVAPAFIGLAGRVIPDNATPTGVSLHNLTDIAGFTDRLRDDEYFRTIDSFILPTAILKNLDPVRNKNNFDILAPIKKVEYIKQGESYIIELDFGSVTLPMAISEHDILNHQAPQAGSRFHGVAWSQCCMEYR